MKIIHISQQRYDFILRQGYQVWNVKPISDGDNVLAHANDPNAITYHILSDELALCETCQATCQSVDANSPAELEICKSFPLDKTIVMLRNQRQSDILTAREYWMNKS